jgi:hypothetical protein
MREMERGRNTGFSLGLRLSQTVSDLCQRSQNRQTVSKNTEPSSTVSSLGLRSETEKAILSIGLRFETACRGGGQTWGSPEKTRFWIRPLPKV